MEVTLHRRQVHSIWNTSYSHCHWPKPALLEHLLPRPLRFDQASPLTSIDQDMVICHQWCGAPMESAYSVFLLYFYLRAFQSSFFIDLPWSIDLTGCDHWAGWVVDLRWKPPVADPWISIDILMVALCWLKAGEHLKSSMKMPYPCTFIGLYWCFFVHASG